MENEKHPIIDTELLNQKLKKQSFIPVQLKEIHNQKKLILENDLESFFDLVKSFNQEHVFYKYWFYNQEDYFIPNHHFEEFPKEYQDAITNHNSELDQFDFNTPKQLEIFIIKDGVLIGIQFNNYFLEENNIPSAEDKTYEINYRFQFKDNSEKKDKEKELREIIFKDPEFKYCKNQESRYWYLLELLEQDGMEEYRYLSEDPGVYFNGKVKMFMDKTWTLYKEIKNKK